MSRSKNNKNDWRRYRKFEQENEKLRKEVAKLRKVINGLVVDHLEERVTRIEEGKEPVIPLCSVCGNDDTLIVPVKRVDGEFEVKICKSCGHRSQLRKKSGL